MKVKMLVNFKCIKTHVKSGQVFEGDFVKEIDNVYSVKLLEQKGILEILENDIIENIEPILPEVERGDSFSDIVIDEPKRPKKSKKR